MSNKKEEENSTLNFLLTRYHLRFPGNFCWHYWLNIDDEMMYVYDDRSVVAVPISSGCNVITNDVKGLEIRVP